MKAVQQRIAQVYYTHGLFCASHPLSIICAVICLALLACYPLTNLPLPGKAPEEVNTPIKDYILPSQTSNTDRRKDDMVKQKWYLSQPVGYVQQVVVKGTVLPWESTTMLPSDAVRGPLAKVFDVLNTIRNFKINDEVDTISIDHVCLRIGEIPPNKRIRGFLPEYNCLIISPANFWNGDVSKFNMDSEELKTVNKMYSQPLETSPTLQDLLFGIPWKKTGVSRYLIRNRRRTITYAITLLYKTFNPKFTEALQEKLESQFPETTENSTHIQHIVHILYKDTNYFVDYTLLLVTYFVLLLYIYFSVRKIEMVKSKWGLAISAVATVIASLFMSVSICTLFGLTPTLNGGEIFPYLVVLIGLENVIVLTKSVVSTPVCLDVKYRVAHGLSKEGWSITKNLLAELFITLVGFFTFVPAIQEFCIFAVVGLLSDFFLQMVFFVTVLSVDIRRMELSDLQKQSVQQEMSKEELSFPPIEPLIRCPVMTHISTESPMTGRRNRSQSTPGPGDLDVSGSPPSPYYDTDDTLFPSPTILPRRLRFLYFWARTRMFQRAIMACTLMWIVLIVYKTGLVEKLTAASESLSLQQTDSIPGNNLDSPPKWGGAGGGRWVGRGGQWAGPGGQWIQDVESSHGNKEEDQGMEHGDKELWRQLSFKHWKTLLTYYNISLSGRHISILPSIHLSITVTPEEAIKVRHPLNTNKINPNQNTQPSGLGEKNSPESVPERLTGGQGLEVPNLKLFYPQGIKEFSITVVLAILSILLLLYFLVVLYKCCCSRNYDKWRSSWIKKSKREKANYYRHIVDSVPIVLRGHSLGIECLATDGPLVVSSCLGRQLRVWDSVSGECITNIQRKGVTPPMKRKPCLGRNIEDSDDDLYAEFHGDREFSLPNKPVQTDGGSSNFRVNLTSRFSQESSLPWPIDSTESRLPLAGGDASSLHPGTARRRIQTTPEHQLQENLYEDARHRSLSTGSNILTPDSDPWSAPAVWCLVARDNIIICGCGNGRIEFWDSLTGVLRYLYDDCKDGVTCICVNGAKVMAARINGDIDFLELETFQKPVKFMMNQTTALHNRGHVRHGSGQADVFPTPKHWEEVIHYSLIERVNAHQQPINCLESVGGRVVSASIDHTLKVFRVEDCVCLYTLYGHQNSVTALYLDKIPPYSAVSGSVDSTVRLWDLVTGACVHKLKGHTGVVSMITCTNQYIISCGQDDLLCVWERSQGRLVHRIQDDCGFTSLAMMSCNILVTGGESCICLWYIHKGEMIRKVSVGSPFHPASVNFVQVIGNATVVCDYSNEIHIIQCPTILEKSQ